MRRFYASVRIDIRRIGSLKSGEETIGACCRATVVKNKVAPPFRKTEFDILFNEGISWTGDLLDLAVLHRVVEKSGAWFSFGSTRLGQGREKVREFMKENRDITGQILTQVKQKLGIDQNEAATRSSDKPSTESASESSDKPAASDKPGAKASPQKEAAKTGDAPAEVAASRAVAAGAKR